MQTVLLERIKYMIYSAQRTQKGKVREPKNHKEKPYFYLYLPVLQVSNTKLLIFNRDGNQSKICRSIEKCINIYKMYLPVPSSVFILFNLVCSRLFYNSIARFFLLERGEWIFQRTIRDKMAKNMKMRTRLSYVTGAFRWLKNAQ